MKASFFTLGCKVNQYETAALQKRFIEAGYEIVDDGESADVCVVNSCTVTAEGDRKSLQKLRRLRQKNPGAVLCLCGCFPQAFPQKAAAVAEADVVMGSKNRADLLEAVSLALSGRRVVKIAPHGETETFEELTAGRLHARTRAFVKIEDGCEGGCAYCIIPAARGPVRSKPLAGIAAELGQLVRQECAEVVLAGVNLSRYGQDIGLRLVDAVALACESGIPRVRLSSLEPELLTSGDIERMAGLKRLCPHFHMSLQSGSDGVLKRMRRRYDTVGYKGLAEKLRAAFPNAALTTDIMTGFPGETDAEFAESVAFCKELGFARMHVFSYSKREGTAAAEMPGQVPEGLKRERAALMREAAGQCRRKFMESQLGVPARVLFETRRPDGMWEGYTENYTPVAMAGYENLNGRITEVTPARIDGDCCIVE